MGLRYRFTRRACVLSALLALALPLSVVTPLTPAHAEIVERIAAVVGNDVITLSEVDELVNAVHQQTLEGISDSSERLLKRQGLRLTTVEQMIDQRLLVQQYTRLQISATEQDIDRVVEAICKQNNITEDVLLAELARQGMSLSEYRDQMRQHVLQTRFIEQQIRPKVSITEEDVKKLYLQKVAELGGADVVELTGVLIAVARSGGPEAIQQSQKNAEQARALLEQGMTPDDVAKKFTDGSVTSLGQMGSFKQGELMEPLDSAAFGLKQGQVSAPLESSQGLFLLKVTQRGQQTEAADFDQVKDQLYRRLYEQQVEEHMQAFTKNARKETHVEVLLQAGRQDDRPAEPRSIVP